MIKKNRTLFFFPLTAMLIAFLFVACSTKNSNNSMSRISKELDIQGHRGARGLFPENTVTAFTEAVKLGVNTLEMDVVVSNDSQLVVSHEAWMNDAFCTHPDGRAVEKDSAMSYNLYKMNYSEIAGFDCGKRGNANFPLQKAIPEHKPLLSEVITKVEAYIKENKLPSVAYNIETKSEPANDGIYNPDPATFVRLLYSELKKQNILEHVIIQSFDVRTLQELHKVDSSVKTALLVENTKDYETELNKLGFSPSIYSPDFHLINDTLVKALHEKNIQLIPWTVNEPTDMKTLADKGVDGIITDYPDKAINILRNKENN